MIKATVIYNIKTLRNLKAGQEVPSLETLLRDSDAVASYLIFPGNLVGEVQIKDGALEDLKMTINEFVIVEPEREVRSL